MRVRGIVATLHRGVRVKGWHPQKYRRRGAGLGRRIFVDSEIQGDIENIMAALCVGSDQYGLAEGELVIEPAADTK